jgi:hypothetical protein
MTDTHTDTHTHAPEKCDCGQIVLTPKQAAGHSTHCDGLGDSTLLRRGFDE